MSPTPTLFIPSSKLPTSSADKESGMETATITEIE